MRPLIVFSSPAPSMIVVLSLSMRTFFARPSWLSSTLSSLMPELFEDGGATGDDGDVFEHRLAAIAKAGGFDGGDLQRAAQLVHDQRREGFAFNVFGDDEERLAGLGGFAQHGHQIAGAADFLFVDQDVAIIEHRFHRRGVGDEVGAEIALVELHAFDEFDGRVERSCLLRR